MNSKVIRDEPCPECRKMGRDTTGNHLMVYADGGKYCNRCGHYEHPNNNNNKRESMDNKWTIGKVQELNALDLDSRGLKASTLEKYGVKVAVKETTGEPDIVFFPRYSNGQLTGYKGKMLDGSGYFAVGNTRNSELFGQNVFPSGGKMVVVTEGEMDALAAHQIFLSKGKNYKVVSLPDGANPSALIKVQSIHEYLESYENVVLSFDMDKPGRTATEAAVKLLSPGKARVMEYTEKDANDMLLQGKISDYFTALSNARPVKPQSIVSSGDTWERINNRKEVSSLPYPEDWSVLNKKTYGLRLGELDTWTSGSGMGKSQVLKELIYHILMSTEESVGILALEEPLEDTVEALMSLHLNKRIHLPDVRKTVSEEERYNAWLATAGTNRFHIYDHWGSDDEENIIYSIRYLVQGLGCRYIILDHLSIVVSEFANEGDERKNIDALMSKLKRLTQELNIWIGLVVHLRKTSGGKSFEEGGVPTLDDLRGSGAIKQLSNSVYALSRDQQCPDEYYRNVSQLHVLKSRFTGDTGPADKLFYDKVTGRMSSIPEELEVTIEV